MEQLFQTILPDLQNVLGLILTGVASWAALELKRRFGVDIKIKELDKDTQLRNLVIMALTTGVKAAAMRHSGLSALEQADEAVDHALRSVPGALEGLGLGLDRTVLRNRALAIQFDLNAVHLPPTT
jgi:hypothetical protein